MCVFSILFVIILSYRGWVFAETMRGGGYFFKSSSMQMDAREMTVELL